ncbi:hypothetical protein ACFSJQ_11400 [Vibrio olivae]|uniref:Uncharacterized protein n=1 Tax=Vibrio olivae TaxID=1243002 RepID=A0ABV5HNR1_9VIBR
MKHLHSKRYVCASTMAINTKMDIVSSRTQASDLSRDFGSDKPAN